MPSRLAGARSEHLQPLEHLVDLVDLLAGGAPAPLLTEDPLLAQGQLVVVGVAGRLLRQILDLAVPPQRQQRLAALGRCLLEHLDLLFAEELAILAVLEDPSADRLDLRRGGVGLVGERGHGDRGGHSELQGRWMVDSRLAPERQDEKYTARC